jgi:hypothetical protein
VNRKTALSCQQVLALIHYEILITLTVLHNLIFPETYHYPASFSYFIAAQIFIEWPVTLTYAEAALPSQDLDPSIGPFGRIIFIEAVLPVDRIILIN